MATLYLVGTPIGNLEDITFRAVKTLNQVDLIACEDTRITRKLCTHYEINTPLKSYHEHNKEQQTSYLIHMLAQGNDIALVSDAGLPLISDPGYELVVEARAHHIDIVTIPGPNAGLTALMGSGLPSYTYTFLGFLPRKEKDKVALLEERMYQDSTLIIYESPYRVKATLEAIHKVDPSRKVTIARELTKKFEQIQTSSIEQMLSDIEQSQIPLKGEFVVLVEGAPQKVASQWFENLSITEHVNYYIKEQDMKSKKAIKMVAEERVMKTGDVYDIYHEIHDE